VELGKVLDRLVSECGDENQRERITAAQTEYFERRGRVFEDEDLFEAWTQAFLEWYVVEREWQAGMPAAAAMALSPDWQEKGQWLPALRAWAHSQRSLAEVRELSKGRVAIEDLIGGAVFEVVEDRNLYGVERGDIVEVRLVGFAGAVYFGRTFVYHPRGTNASIRRRLAGLRSSNASRADTVDAIAALRIRCERYRHVSPLRIYESDENLPVAGEAAS
jgi:hypothetical protein